MFKLTNSFTIVKKLNSNSYIKARCMNKMLKYKIYAHTEMEEPFQCSGVHDPDNSVLLIQNLASLSNTESVMDL